MNNTLWCQTGNPEKEGQAYLFLAIPSEGTAEDLLDTSTESTSSQLLSKTSHQKTDAGFLYDLFLIHCITFNFSSK